MTNKGNGMITFETQEEFERAVMEVVVRRLGVSVNLYEDDEYRGVTDSYVSVTKADAPDIWDKEA